MSGCELRTQFAATAALAPALVNCFSTEPAAAHAAQPRMRMSGWRIKQRLALAAEGWQVAPHLALPLALARTPWQQAARQAFTHTLRVASGQTNVDTHPGLSSLRGTASADGGLINRSYGAYDGKQGVRDSVYGRHPPW
jgi:hypothetical protein